MIPDKERSNSWIVPKKHMSLTDECKPQLGLSGGGSSKQYRRIRQAIKYSCEGMIPIDTHLSEDIIPFTRRGTLSREGQGVKRLIKLLKVFLCNFTEVLPLIFSLNGDKALARDLLMLLCQTQVRNDNRKINSQRKVAGETIKRGRKPKVSGIIHESEPGLSS